MNLFYRTVALAAIGCALLSHNGANAQYVWTSESSTGFTPRCFLSTAVIDGKIYALGGTNENSYVALNTLEVFDPSNNTWTTPATTGTFTPRYGIASVVFDGKIYAMGGGDQSDRLNTVEVFDPRTNTWSTPVTTGTFSPRSTAAAVVVNGKFYVMGGVSATGSVNTLEVFDPATNQWSTPTTTGAFTKRYGHAAVVVDNKIYVIGGLGARSLQVFDPATSEWSTLVTVGSSKSEYGITASILNGKVFVFGGEYGTLLEMFDPLSNTWSEPTVNRPYAARQRFPSAVANDKIYIMGGEKFDNTFSNVVESFAISPSSVAISDLVVETIDLFPNPTSRFVTVRGVAAGSTRAIVVNELGEMVMDIASLQNDTDVTLDISSLPIGRYFVRVVGPRSVTAGMVVRE